MTFRLAEVRIDGEKIEQLPEYTSNQKLLTVRTDPENPRRHEFLQLDKYDRFTLSLFETPLDNHNILTLAGEMQRVNDKQVTMGDFPHLRLHGVESFHTTLTPGNSYDFFIFGRTKEGSDLSLENGYYLTGRVPRLTYLTFEYMRYFAIKALGLTPEEAKTVKAQVRYTPGFHVGPDGGITELSVSSSMRYPVDASDPRTLTSGVFEQPLPNFGVVFSYLTPQGNPVGLQYWIDRSAEWFIGFGKEATRYRNSIPQIRDAVRK